VDNLLQQGIAAVKSGDKEHGYQLLTRAVQDRALAEQAWLWLSATVDHDSERLFCLENALHANPGNAAAQRGADILRQKGVFPAAPTGPAGQPAVQPAYVIPAPAEKIPASPAVPKSAPVQQPQAPVPGPTREQQQEMGSRVKFVAQELAHKTPRKLIQKNLIDQGLSPEAAASVLKQTEEVLRKVRREKAKKQMMRGLFWTGAGVGVTLLTQLFARQLGGYFVVFYGAIFVGVINLLVGLVNWLAEV
jgi:hypothetical protein